MDESKLQTGVIKVGGMVTQHDADKVLRALHEVWGVRGAHISLNDSEAIFSYDEKAASYHDFQQAIADIGFKIDQKEGSRDIKS
ncbi:heavy-metal-associated domain-containing protein [Bacillus songklensis]|uniref:Heavy-metal-associated domain-containing protein n=1 Tax=Bacillus songklensis TaxID=1069116 RepID=A0ABV8B492_9BACI